MVPRGSGESQWSRVRKAHKRPKFPTGPLPALAKEYKKEAMYALLSQGSLTHEEKFSRLEETRQAALEVAQEEDETA
jgi:hypothetical protein